VRPEKEKELKNSMMLSKNRLKTAQKTDRPEAIPLYHKASLTTGLLEQWIEIDLIRIDSILMG
jgi:hypothetical protein